MVLDRFGHCKRNYRPIARGQWRERPSRLQTRDKVRMEQKAECQETGQRKQEREDLGKDMNLNSVFPLMQPRR